VRKSFTPCNDTAISPTAEAQGLSWLHSLPRPHIVYTAICMYEWRLILGRGDQTFSVILSTESLIACSMMEQLRPLQPNREGSNMTSD